MAVNNGDPNINHWPTTQNFAALRPTDPNAWAAAPFVDCRRRRYPGILVGSRGPGTRRATAHHRSASRRREADGAMRCRPRPGWSPSPSRSRGSRTSTATAASTSAPIPPATATTRTVRRQQDRRDLHGHVHGQAADRAAVLPRLQALRGGHRQQRLAVAGGRHRCRLRQQRIAAGARAWPARWQLHGDHSAQSGIKFLPVSTPTTCRPAMNDDGKLDLGGSGNPCTGSDSGFGLWTSNLGTTNSSIEPRCRASVASLPARNCSMPASAATSATS